MSNQLENEISTLFKNGSVWVQADFHLHTRKDGKFNYSPSGTYPHENTFPTDFVEELRSKDIRVGVITNHNKFDLAEFRALRTKVRKQEIFLLPGVELSISEGSRGIHLLIVFADDWIEKDFINQFLANVFPGKTPDQYETENGHSQYGLLEVTDALDKFQKDYFYICAHVDQDNGLCNELTPGRIHDLYMNEKIAKRILAFQKVRSSENKKALQQLMPGAYPAEVEGSDAKCLQDIGTKSARTWIKIGDYSFEAVRIALLDREHRLSSQKPTKPQHSYIRGISFEGGALNGQNIEFSPELNTLIGIRGSGKSAILEAISYVLDFPDRLNRIDNEYKQQLIQYALGSGGRIKLTAIDRHGKNYEVYRTLNRTPEVYCDGKIMEGLFPRKTIIHQPMFFGQKELAARGEYFDESLIDRLMGDNLTETRREISEKKANKRVA
ncbi:MAG: AAA family ATPase [Sphaerochaetaceae bacterium]|nr:AAA family ATPase [Sphaerochaetaceae bacterium]